MSSSKLIFSSAISSALKNAPRKHPPFPGKKFPYDAKKPSVLLKGLFYFGLLLLIVTHCIGLKTPFLGLLPRQQESNLYFTLRRHTFYPLNYGEPK